MFGISGDLVADERIQTDTRHTAVDLVVDPGVFAVVGAVGIRSVDVVRIGNGVFQRTIRLGAHDGFRFVGNTPANQRIRDKTRNTVDLAARRHAQHPHVAGVTAAVQTIIFVQLARPTWCTP